MCFPDVRVVVTTWWAIMESSAHDPRPWNWDERQRPIFRMGIAFALGVSYTSAWRVFLWVGNSTLHVRWCG